jgi:hypothetical protein
MAEAVSNSGGGRFDYVRYDDVSAMNQQRAKDLMTQVELFITHDLGAGRPQSLALTHLEEVYMWIGKAIRDNQVARGVHVDDDPKRTNE